METLLLLIIIVPLGIIVLYGTYMMQKWKNFNRFLKRGDIVDFFVNEERHQYTVVGVGHIFCKIQYADGDEIKVHKSEIYPNFWTNYKPAPFIE